MFFYFVIFEVCKCSKSFYTEPLDDGNYIIITTTITIIITVTVISSQYVSY